jgi:hypothetical protein
MLRNLFHFIAGRFANFLAWGIGFVSVNHIHIDSERSHSIIKMRSMWNRIPVTIGSFVFRFRDPAIRVLPTREWIEWESAIQSAMGQKSERIKSGIRSEKLPGEPLAKLLKQTEYSEQQKRDWVVLACRELANLHQIRLDPGNVHLSHADASVSNVMIVRADGQSSEVGQVRAGKSATWFDFDLRHDLTAASIDRQADDLRALIFTALVCCRWNDVQSLIDGLKLAYANSEVWAALKQVLANRKLDCDVFHLAQLRRANRTRANWAKLVSIVDLV